MKPVYKNGFLCIVVVIFAFLLFGCASSQGGWPEPEKIVPKKEMLIANLEKQGYAVTEQDAVEGFDGALDRVVAQKGRKFIDIVYGLSAEEAETVFELYCKMYPDDFYILARNGNYIYCVSDKRTFTKAGFTSIANVGTQYIHN